MPVRNQNDAANSPLSDDPIEDAWAFATTSTNEGSYVPEFILTAGQKARIVVLSKSPYVFKGHTIKYKSKKGTDRYSTDPCQKMKQQTCIMCESAHEGIGEQRNFIAFEVLDSRGTYKNGEFDKKPTVKVFLVPQYVAQALNELRQSCGGDLSKYIVEVTKSNNLTVKLATKQNPDGSFIYEKAPDLSKYNDQRIDLREAYAPKDDTELREFLKKRLNARAFNAGAADGFAANDDSALS